MCLEGYISGLARHHTHLHVIPLLSWCQAALKALDVAGNAFAEVPIERPELVEKTRPSELQREVKAFKPLEVMAELRT